MPTGYTAKISEGQQTFEQFAMDCARAFGACVTMRDEPADAPIPEKFEPSSYHAESIARAKETLNELNALSADEAEVRATKAWHEAEAFRKRMLAECRERRQRYETMRAKVMAWQPPSDHHKLKSFMLEQLQTSLEWDCDLVSYDQVSERLTGEAWLAAELTKVLGSISYHETAQAKEVKLAADRTRWVAELRASLKAVRP